jgi:OOP family OmpA-OmpF porin
MKYSILVMVVACMFMFVSITTAQVKDPVKTTEKKSEQKVNQNVDQTINKGLNSIESGVKGMFKKKV